MEPRIFIVAGKSHIKVELSDPPQLISSPSSTSGLFFIVDNQDPDLHYVAGWAPLPAAISFEYGDTITSPGPQGSTAQYSFYVFARVAADTNNATTVLNFVIGGTIETDSLHNMVITLTTTSGDVFLDYTIYEGSPNTPIGSSSRLLVFDR
ncbi:hypothetical protein K438DRAFT_2002609 [Mycena galopus ATCC 62051]|nr:hypothetical protein K438DRAFT_2002609 [Mycena galopus ATCC 62051]